MTGQARGVRECGVRPLPCSGACGACAERWARGRLGGAPGQAGHGQGRGHEPLRGGAQAAVAGAPEPGRPHRARVPGCRPRAAARAGAGFRVRWPNPFPQSPSLAPLLVQARAPPRAGPPRRRARALVPPGALKGERLLTSAAAARLGAAWMGMLRGPSAAQQVPDVCACVCSGVHSACCLVHCCPLPGAPPVRCALRGAVRAAVTSAGRSAEAALSGAGELPEPPAADRAERPHAAQGAPGLALARRYDEKWLCYVRCFPFVDLQCDPAQSSSLLSRAAAPVLCSLARPAKHAPLSGSRE